MDGHTLFTELKQILADLYLAPADAQRLAADAGLDLAHILFDNKAINNWHNILAVAITSATLEALLNRAVGEYGSHQPLVVVYEHYWCFLAAGGRMEAPPILGEQTIVVEQGDFVAGGKTVYGDEVHGDKIVYQGIAPRVVDAAAVAAAQAKLAELPLDQIPLIAPLPTGSRMPFSPNPLFMGREAELRQLAAWLKGGQIVATTGLGGLGKSQLAVAFAHHYGQYFAGGVFWLSLADPESVSSQVADCGLTMGEMRPDYPQLDLPTQVALVLAAWQSELPRLLIFDNCESAALLAQWRPPMGGARVLVTSRRSSFDAPLGVRTLPLQTLPRAQSLELLCKFPVEAGRTPYDAGEVAVLDAIAAFLGDLPLALHLAGSFLARYRRVVTPAAYLEQLQTLDSLEHRSLQSQEVSPTAHDQHVARTFALSYQQLDKANEVDALALRLLAQTACFAPGELIPRELLLLTITQENEASADPLDQALQTEDALHRLAELGLAESEAKGGIILHRLLALFTQHVDRESAATAARVVEVALLAEANRLNNRGIPQPLRLWQVHLRHRTDLAKVRLDAMAARLCNTLGFHLKMVGELTAAQPYYERAVDINKAVWGDQHPDTASSLNNLGGLLQAMGEYAAAKSYYERALIIRKDVLGEQHPDTAQSLNNLGHLLQAMGEMVAAKPHLERALAIHEAVFGEQDSNTALSFNNLGGLLQEMALNKPSCHQPPLLRLTRILTTAE